jgi:hypothetical protein
MDTHIKIYSKHELKQITNTVIYIYQPLPLPPLVSNFCERFERKSLHTGRDSLYFTSGAEAETNSKGGGDL